MPETADVGDAGSVVAPVSGAHKRPRIEAIHDVIKKIQSTSQENMPGRWLSNWSEPR